MQQDHSPPFVVAAATPWLWKGNAPGALEYQVRFYATAKAVDELDQAGGARTVSIAEIESWYYGPELDATIAHTSTMADTAPVLVTAGEWQLLGTGLGRGQLLISAAASTLPAGASHYRILVRSR